jgi:hypothetical protein
MELHFATYFDINYRSSGLVLCQTLKKHHSYFSLYALCLDEKVEKHLLELQLPFAENAETLNIIEGTLYNYLQPPTSGLIAVEADWQMGESK